MRNLRVNASQQRRGRAHLRSSGADTQWNHPGIGAGLRCIRRDEKTFSVTGDRRNAEMLKKLVGLRKALRGHPPGIVPGIKEKVASVGRPYHAIKR